MSFRILIVDDHQAVRDGLRSLLGSRPQWEVCGEATDGVEALEKAKKLRPDLVLMDVSMPRMDGMAAARLIRTELPGTRVVLVSQNDIAALKNHVKDAGADAFVTKNTLADDLLPTIDKLLLDQPARTKASRKSTKPTALPDWLAGSGALGELINEYDWSKTPLGPLAGWPASLRTSVNLMLNSQHPMWIGWGPDATFLYNEAYIQVLSPAKHPWAMGRPAREVWAEIWYACGPLVDKVFKKGEASFEDEMRLFMSRGDFLEETYYSFSYSPIRNEAGEVGGLFCPSTEVTAKVINARRLKTLSELSANALLQKTTEAACSSAIATLGQNLDDVPFAVLYLLDCDDQKDVLRRTGQAPGDLGSVAPEVVSFAAKADTSWPFAEVMKSKRPQVVSVRKMEGLPLGPAQQPLTQAMALPLTSPGEDRSFGVLIAGVNPTRKLQAEYGTFYELLSNEIAAAIQNARATEDERKRLKSLAELDRVKTAFFSNISHEFRTPLTLLLGPLEDSLAASDSLPGDHRERLQVAHRNSIRLLRLVNALLDFSRIEAGRIQASYEPTDLSRLTAELASVFRSTTERAGLKLLVKCPPISEAVYVDREMWEKIVFNLLSNAFKFTFKGEIEVSLALVGETVELAVRDTGTGIPQKELPHLFERFYRVKGAQGRTFEGSGIGLSLVQELVKLHGGTVRVKSEMNHGSTFVVVLPTGKDHLPPERIEAGRTVESTALRGEAYVQEALRWLPSEETASDIPTGMLSSTASLPAPENKSGEMFRILLADDNADMREYVKRLLSGQYEVDAVSDGEAAWEKARQRRPDLILSDIMMPRLDGFGLLAAVRKEESLRNVPVILLSARAGEESRIEGLQSGADDYLVKPFSARELLARVRSHLAMAQIRQEATELDRKLRLETQLLASIVSSSDDAIVSKSLDGIITSWNHSAERLFGYSPEEAIGKHITLVVPEDRLDEEKDILSRLARGERVDHFHTVRRRKDGTLVDVALSISPLKDPTGRVIGASKVARDVTAQRRAEEALRQSEERFRAIVETTPECVKVVDATGTVLHMNSAGLEMVEADSKEAVIGQNVYGLIAPEYRETFRDFVERGCRGESGSIDYDIIGFKGQRRHMSTHGAPLRNPDGRIVQLSVTRDVTARRRAEERERQMITETVAANAKFRVVFEQTTVFAGIMTNDGVLIEANKLCLEACGFRAEEVLGQQFWQTRWWRDFPESQEKVRAATPLAAQGIPYREILNYSWADGTERLVDFALYPIVDDQGKVLFLHPTGIDITDLKRAEEDYRKLAETLEAEVRARTSELEQRNIEVLQQSELLRGFSQRLLQTQDEERRHIARELHDSAGQTLTILGMNLAQLVQKAGRRAPELAADAERTQQLVQQLHREIRTASYLLHPPLLDESGLPSALSWYIQGLSERSGLDIKLTIADSFGRLPRDMELVVFRLVQECLSNIHRHSGSKTANIRITRELDVVHVEIADHGKGMSPAKLATIQSQASGVGIRGMLERIRQFDGTMKIESDASGTRILVRLPIPSNAFSEETTGFHQLPTAV